MNSGTFKDIIYKMWLEIIYLIDMYKKDLALNNMVTCHKTKPNPTAENFISLWGLSENFFDPYMRP